MGGWAAMGLAVAHGDRVRSLVLADTLGGIPIEGWWKTAARVATRRALQSPRARRTTSAFGNPERAHLYLQIGGLRRDPHADPTQLLRTMGDVTFDDAQLAALRDPDAVHRRHRRRDLPARLDRRRRLAGTRRTGRDDRRRRAFAVFRAARGLECPGSGISAGMLADARRVVDRDASVPNSASDWRSMNAQIGPTVSIADAIRGTIGCCRTLSTRRGNTMISVVEWIAPSRNAAWVAACFGSLGA